MVKLPDCHNANIIGVSNKNKDLIINIELDSAFEPNKELLTLYLKNCNRSQYWYKILKKYAVDGFMYKGNFYTPNSIDKIKLKGNELIVHLHHLGSWIKHIKGKLVKLPIPPQKKIIRIRFDILKIN
jgi:hypothetical protein